MAEYRLPNGGWGQGYFCLTCGKPTSMMGGGHGPGKCEPNSLFVAALIHANKPENNKDKNDC